MKRLLYVLTGLCLLAGVFTGCEKKPLDEDNPNGSGTTPGGTTTEQTGTLKGTVTDKGTDEVLSGVIITLQPDNNQVQTAEDGTYILENLKAGIYTLKAQKDGYDDYENAEIQLEVGQTLTLDIEMKWVPQEPELQENYTETAFGMSLEMVYVKGGEFEMGATAEQGDDAKDNEKPVRTVKLDGYHIGKFEVTQEQWKAVMETEPSYFKGDNLPVERVTWEEAQEFCKKLSEQTGKKYVLPTEAEWEYAARGGNKGQHYKYAGSNDIDEVAWYYDNSGSTTHPVGTKKNNELGIYDMSGNVWEWCSDWYGDYGSSSVVNPQGPESGSYRVIRGGGWNRNAGNCRVSSRYSNNPENYITRVLGFRVACSSK